MIELLQFRYGQDNLGYLLYAEREALVVDPGDPGLVVEFLKKNQLELKGILNTHSHGDHTSGNRSLERATGAPIWECRELLKKEYIKLESERIDIIPTPGHTEDSLCLLSGRNLLTGDTLFIANVGNCQAFRMRSFAESLSRLLALPEETRVFPGHDYTERSLKRAMEIEKSNAYIKEFRERYKPPPVAGTIGDEKKINPYLRASEPEVAEHLRLKGKNTANDFECLKSFLELY